MTHLIGDSVDEIYQTLLTELVTFGQVVAPRGKLTRELIGVHLELKSPYFNILQSKIRSVNYHFMMAEWLWMQLGMNDVEMLAPYNKQISQFSDDGIFFRGAYGPKIVEQLPYVLETLRNDPESRQAVITTWRERPGRSKDVPCTVMFQFLIRDKALDMITYMRSNDAWLGVPYDLFNFTQLQASVGALLGIDVGTYHHMVGSMHLYEEHAALAEQVSKAELPETVVSMPPVTIMPGSFRSMFIGLTLMAKDAAATDDLVNWLSMTPLDEQPWDLYLNLLGHRFHKRDDLLRDPWKQLVLK